MKRSVMLALITLFLVAFSQTPASAVPINLNDFDSYGNVTGSLDGNSATIIEDPAYIVGIPYLSNDPYFGNIGIFIPEDSSSLTFMYDFQEPDGNDDEFYAFLFDPDTFFLLQDQYGNDLEIFVSSTRSGTVTWDLLNAGFLGSTVGMQFELNFFSSDPFPSDDLSLNSSVFMSDVRINPVPEPSTILLLAMGLLGLPLIRYVRKFYN